jgi:hypothetical protein
MFDIEALFREADPARSAATPTADSPEGRRMYREVTSGSGARRGALHGSRARVVAGVVLAGAAAAVAALVVPGGPSRPSSSAAAVLARVAAVAASQPTASPLSPGDYLYMASVGVALSASSGPSQTYSVLAPVTRQVWIAADGSGRLAQTYGTPSFLTPADRAAWVADGKPSVLPASANIDSLEGKGQLAPDLAGLPTDPTALLADIEDGKVENAGVPVGAAEAFQTVGDLLENTAASPALRAALYHVAAEIPGVTLVGTVTDAVGRSGTAVAYTSGGERDELIFDPTTSDLLGETTVVTDPSQLCRLDVSVGTVVYETSYVASGVVSSTSDVPPGTSLGSYHVAIPPNPPATGSTAPSCPSVPETTTEPPVSSTLPPS